MGKENQGNNIILPVRAICFLERAESNRTEKIGLWEAVPLMVRQSYMPLAREKQEKTLEMIDRILSAVPVYRMHCNNRRDDAVQIACRELGVEMQ